MCRAIGVVRSRNRASHLNQTKATKYAKPHENDAFSSRPVDGRLGARGSSSSSRQKTKRPDIRRFVHRRWVTWAEQNTVLLASVTCRSHRRGCDRVQGAAGHRKQPRSERVRARCRRVGTTGIEPGRRAPPSGSFRVSGSTSSPRESGRAVRSGLGARRRTQRWTVWPVTSPPVRSARRPPHVRSSTRPHGENGL